ncbi:hypothetical protein HNQ91_003949 [Filimonas zeae]|uniref:Microcystin-dependent protein n=1 Tax=Filimonas zeae TaxID=1737353 RepID=A0A917J3W0_9BACT|nr:hypothetical protein [Filimonas zeae]MDR6340876.1 hypothetical protein [Filimonas zeae]GGH78105.1 hypothetical protein GCM10011379_45480 [Filimonas zeae]
MNKTIDFSQAGGLYIYQDTLDYMQKAYGDVLDAVGGFLGSRFILSGCVEQNGTVSDGWLVMNGEVLPFSASLKADYVTIENSSATEQFEDGEQKSVYLQKRAKLSTIATGNTPFADFVRLPFGDSLKDFAYNVQTVLKGLLVENEVILSGCEVSAVNTASSALTIAPGFCMFKGKLMAAPAFSGRYPVFLKEDGAYVNDQPASGLFISFDPYTSQRYADVMNRALTKPGKIEMYETKSDRFENITGIGKWEMKGFQLMQAMQGRVPVGYWFDGNAVTNVTDLSYRTEKSQGGERMHGLTISEMPSHNHSLLAYQAGRSDNANDRDVMVPGGNSFTGSTGGGQPHNNMQPYTVVVYVKRMG